MLYSINSAGSNTFVYGLKESFLYGLGVNPYVSFGNGGTMLTTIKPELLNLPTPLKIK